MPEIDYLVLAEYVRQDAGMTHIMAAGIDTFYVPEGQPVAVPVGIVARISFSSRDDVGAEHDISLVFQGSGGDLLTVSRRFPTPPPQPGVPEHWRTAISIAFRLALPIPSHGDYRLQVTLDDDPRLSRSVDVRAIAPPAEQN
jgi:Family of unknown function (DUF6941)